MSAASERGLENIMQIKEIISAPTNNIDVLGFLKQSRGLAWMSNLEDIDIDCETYLSYAYFDSGV